MGKGVVILSLGNPLYGEFASNLAISIRAYSDIPVTVLHDKTSLATLDKDRMKMFDKVAVPESEFMYQGKGIYQRVKTRLYDYSPYDETLYIDADSLMTKDVSGLFGGNDFSIGSMGYYDCKEEKVVDEKYWFWAEPISLKKHYKLKNKIGKTYSGIMCWRKGEVAEKMFKAATKVYDDRTNRKLTKTWGGDIGDELCFNVAIGLTDYEPADWMPIYFEPYHGSLRHAQMLEYHGITLAGNEPPPYVATLYKEKCREHASRLGIRFIMPTNKKDALGVRKTW